MQIGMIIGYFTSWPANVWLVNRGIKVPDVSQRPGCTGTAEASDIKDSTSWAGREARPGSC